MGTRHLGRELALKALYRIDICGDASDDDLSLFLEKFPTDSETRAFARSLVTGVTREKQVLDRQIADVLENWTIRRLSRVDHNILRLALYELLFVADVPARVTFDEAIELAKRYGDQDSGRFVNGVLDQLAGRLGLREKGDETRADKAG